MDSDRDKPHWAVAKYGLYQENDFAPSGETERDEKEETLEREMPEEKTLVPPENTRVA